MRYFTVVSKDYWDTFVNDLTKVSEIKWNGGEKLEEINPFDDIGFKYNCLINFDTHNNGLTYEDNIDVVSSFINIENFIDKCSELFPKNTFKSIYCIVEKSLWKEFAEILYDNTNVKWEDNENRINTYVCKSDNPYEDDQSALPFECFKDDSGDFRLRVAYTFMVDNLVSKIEFINTIFKEEF